MDGINGISAAQGTAAGLALAAVAYHQDLGDIAIVAAALAGAACSFAPYNVPRARVFLGDCGSYGLGAAMAGVSVALVFEGVPFEAALAPLSLYVADTGTTLLRRVRTGEAWHLPHRTHVYQRLTDTGMTHAQVSGLFFLLVLVCSASGAGALVGNLAVRLSADMLLMAVIAAYLRLPSRAGRLTSQKMREGLT